MHESRLFPVGTATRGSDSQRPGRSDSKIETREGEVRVAGNIESAQVTTVTGTIVADVPTDEMKYQLIWHTSPAVSQRFCGEKVKELSGGRFELKGTYKPEAGASAIDGEMPDPSSEAELPNVKKSRKAAGKNAAVSLSFTTDRGIVLLTFRQ